MRVPCEHAKEKMKNDLLGKTVAMDALKENGVYRLYYSPSADTGYYKRELAVFCHIGQTGLPIFHPLGEPSFQDVFALEGYGEKWLAIFERDGTEEDLGY